MSNAISLRMLAGRLATIRREVGDLNAANRPVGVNINGAYLALTTDNTQIDDSGVIYITAVEAFESAFRTPNRMEQLLRGEK